MRLTYHPHFMCSSFPQSFFNATLTFFRLVIHFSPFYFFSTSFLLVKDPSFSLSLSLSLSIYLFIYLSIYLSIDLSIYLSTGFPKKDARLLKYFKSIFSMILHSWSSLSGSGIFYNFKKRTCFFFGKPCISPSLSLSLYLSGVTVGWSIRRSVIDILYRNASIAK